MIGEVAALGAAVTFGLSTILARRFMVAVSPGAGVLVSIAANVVVFGALALAAAALGLLPPIHPASIALFAAGGLAGTLVGRNLSYVSLERLGASLTVTVRLSNSAFSLLVGYLLLRELPRTLQVLGLVTVTAGLWLSLRSSSESPAPRRGHVDLLGVAIALASAAMFALGDTARRAGLHLTPSPVLGAAIGAVAALAGHLLWAQVHAPSRWPAGPLFRRFDVLGSALLNTAAILLLYVGLRHAPVAVVSVLYNLQVLVVLLLGPLILHGQERLTAWLVAGAVVTLAGTVMILWG